MGVGTARLLFQVFSTLIYIYRHLTNPPQSPNCISQLYFTSLYICISLCCLYLPFSTWLIYRSHQIEMSPPLSTLFLRHMLTPTPTYLWVVLKRCFPIILSSIIWSNIPYTYKRKAFHETSHSRCVAPIEMLQISTNLWVAAIYGAHPRPPSHPKDRARDSREGHYCCRHLL